MRNLEARVAYLEDICRQNPLHGKVDNFHPFGQAPAGNRPGSHSISKPSLRPYSAQRSLRTGGDPNESHEDCPSALSLGNEGTDMDDLPSEVAILCSNASGREPRYLGPSSALSFSRVASEAMGLRTRGTIPSTSDFGESPSRSVRNEYTRTPQWPSPGMAELLSRSYFSNIHPQYPFLHRPTFRVWEQECLRAAQEGTTSTLSNVSMLFVSMVYAIGSLVLDGRHFEAADDYYSTAQDHISFVLDMDSLESIQAILSIAVYSIRSPSGPSLWKISGMAVRHCIELGYHRSAAQHRETEDVSRKEMSRRCFWVAYDLDRYVSCILGLPNAIPDHSIDVEVSIRCPCHVMLSWKC